jgi:hypothetical protein
MVGRRKRVHARLLVLFVEYCMFEKNIFIMKGSIGRYSVAVVISVL